MTSESSDSGLDELMRLSQQFKQEESETTERERQSARHRKKVQNVLGELRAFSISIAAGQLQSIADPGVIEKVEALKDKKGTADLRKLIGDLLSDLEKDVGTIAGSNPELKPVERTVKTLVILAGLLSSLE